jgi:hypothetical protein
MLVFFKVNWIGGVMLSMLALSAHAYHYSTYAANINNQSKTLQEITMWIDKTISEEHESKQNIIRKV